MNPEWVTFSENLAGSVLNGVYQGVVMTALLALIFRGKPCNAATRHATWLVLLLIVALLIPGHLLSRYLRGTRAADSQPSEALAGLDADSFNDAHETIAPEQEGTVPLQPGTESLRGAPATAYSIKEGAWYGSRPEADNTNEQAQAARQPVTKTKIAAGRPVWVAAVLRVMRGALNPFLISAGSIPSWVAGIVIAGWFSISAASLTVLLRRILQIRQLKRQSGQASTVLGELFERICRQIPVRRTVALRISPALQSPVVLGFVHPIVLLPPDLSFNEAEPVLRHELAHVARRDDWANLTQHLVNAVFFFHPAVWWINRNLTLEREIACDDQVLRQFGRPRIYALLLADLAGRLQGFKTLLAPGASTEKTQLQRRINMILNPHRNTSPGLATPRFGLVTLAALLLAGAALYTAPRRVYGQNPPTPPIPPATAIAASPAAGGAGIAVSPAAESPGGVVAVTREGKTFALIAPGFAPPGAPGGLSAAPAPPGLPAPAVVALGDPTPVPAPRPLRAARTAKADASVEERLDRLEKIIESLVERQERKDGPPEFRFKDKPGAQFNWELQTQMKSLAQQQAELEGHRAELNRFHADQMKEHAKQEAMHATDELKKQALKDGERVQKREPRIKMRTQNLSQQIEALRHQMQALEHQKQRLAEEIERLEQSKKSAADLDELLDEEISINEDKLPEKK